MSFVATARLSRLRKRSKRWLQVTLLAFAFPCATDDVSAQDLSGHAGAFLQVGTGSQFGSTSPSPQGLHGGLGVLAQTGIGVLGEVAATRLWRDENQSPTRYPDVQGRRDLNALGFVALSPTPSRRVLVLLGGGLGRVTIRSRSAYGSQVLDHNRVTNHATLAAGTNLRIGQLPLLATVRVLYVPGVESLWGLDLVDPWAFRFGISFGVN